jgi:hypothetical protein
MKRITLFVGICLLSLSSFALSKKPVSHHYSKPYIYLKKGALMEMYKGHPRPVQKDITLMNHTTIHPNGNVDAGSGENYQLKEGQYMTMDGRVRNFKKKHKK